VNCVKVADTAITRSLPNYTVLSSRYRKYDAMNTTRNCGSGGVSMFVCEGVDHTVKDESLSSSQLETKEMNLV
jgi:hypothetical protein